MQTTLDDELIVLLCRFIYMGFDIAMERQSWSHIGFIFFSIVSFHWIKPPNLHFTLFHEICFHSVASLISYLSMTCRSSYYLQGIKLIEIFPPLFASVWVVCHCWIFSLCLCWLDILHSLLLISFHFEGLQMSSLVHTYLIWHDRHIAKYLGNISRLFGIVVCVP